MSNYLNEVSAIVPVTGGAGVDVQGPIEELFASTVRKSGWLWIYYNTLPVGGTFQGILMRMNIYTGAAGLEVVQMCRVPNAGNSNTNPEGSHWNGIGLPWVFAQGVRVSCSIASGRVSGLSSENLVQFRLIEKPI